MPKPLLLLFLGILLFPSQQSACQVWYRSNAAGMALELIPSRLAASRHERYLSVETVSAGELPLLLREYYDPAYHVELRVLYEKKAAVRVQWLLRDSGGTVRLVSASRYPPPVSGVEPREEVEFIELYDEYHLITVERRFSPDGAETIMDYFYNKQVLLRVETRRKPGPDTDETGEENGENNGEAGLPAPAVLITTDHYRYSRSNALRAVERVYHEAGDAGVTRLTFPQLGLTSRVDENFVSPGTPYQSDIPAPQKGERVVYTTDQRGKVLTETREDAEGAARGEIRNTWDGNRLKAVDWKAGGDEWRVEYDYNGAGDRIIERNYRNGVLERVVREEGGQEIEELYLNGRLILRAVWENGRKISETRTRGVFQ